MKQIQILTIEDDNSVRNLISATLSMHEYNVITAANGASGIMLATSHHPDIILLDLGLPDMDGIEVISRIRTWSQVPIIVLSARSETADKIEALDAGADDYLTKPFSVEELMARIRAAQRRSVILKKVYPENSEFVNGKLRIDYAAGLAYLNQNELKLTPIEYKLLCLLAVNIGKVLTRNYIIKEIWGSVSENDSGSLRVFITSLRKKLETDDNEPSMIQTHVGIGYQMIRL
ncbi:MAG: response regulator transcription factor [Solobacterium sp.]|nr:response regulator transcription factor [Solobacterium sp.]